MRRIRPIIQFKELEVDHTRYNNYKASLTIRTDRQAGHSANINQNKTTKQNERKHAC